ncbi:MAG: putative Histidine kinase [Candidatus Saccharibacteria bacterium]|nr:putative Histidine kinase [Candidatus Saccharibacteria bacterium]
MLYNPCRVDIEFIILFIVVGISLAVNIALVMTLFFRSHKKELDQAYLRHLSQILVSIPDLRSLLERASSEIASTLQAEQVSFFLYYSHVSRHQYISAGTQGHISLPIEDVRLLDAYMLTSDKKVYVSDRLHSENVLRRLLLSHKIAIVMPLRQNNQLLGYVLVGNSNSRGYTKKDVNKLALINDELMIVIQNALSLQEVRELNATLQQRIDVATKELRSSNAQLKHLDETKDEFMSMASHQLRTPLTSIKGFLSMVLEEDVGKITPKQRKLLQEAFNSSERMVRLIADFLNISRLQTGKFMIEKVSVDIKPVIKQVLDELELLASSHDIKLQLQMTDKPLMVKADESKIRQVVMNFVDNAIYYSPVNSIITVTVERDKDVMVVKVIDRGIGVPNDEQSRLFTKFFRAKNARKQRPDGTGVGLYLARRVITAHNGSLVFSSTEGKGSTFGFRIPLDHSIKIKK